MVQSYSKETMIKFYTLINNANFSNITEERRNEIDNIVEDKRYYFTNITSGLLSLMKFTAERLIVSSKLLGLNNEDEMAYFYIQMVDPDLKFLEAHECGNKKDEIRKICIKNFHVYDNCLIQLEIKLNETLKLYEEIWNLNRIIK